MHTHHTDVTRTVPSLSRHAHHALQHTHAYRQPHSVDQRITSTGCPLAAVPRHTVRISHGEASPTTAAQCTHNVHATRYACASFAKHLQRGNHTHFTVPAMGAATTVSIFMADRITRGWPLVTLAPSAT